MTTTKTNSEEQKAEGSRQHTEDALVFCLLPSASPLTVASRPQPENRDDFASVVNLQDPQF
jgi:mannose/fructose-specific phosphotransferase system component IIA